jgi:hypothetical protein
MGRRSSFERLPKDKYYTPYEAVVPLLPHLAPGTRFVEPCAGDGRLVRHLKRHGHVCVDAFDIEPEHASVNFADALTVEIYARPGEMCITNPPWSRPLLHALIDHWRVQMPTWFLFDAEWMHTKQSIPFMPYCRKIVSVGRVKWIEGSKMTGKDSVCWYLFDAKADGQTLFYGRT